MIDSRGKPSSGGSGMSLPGARLTPVNGDSQLDDSAEGSDPTIQLFDISRASPTISSSRKATLSPSVKKSPISLDNFSLENIHSFFQKEIYALCLEKARYFLSVATTVSWPMPV
jgi:hypothetical protein